jgi:hypothetical protein
MIQVAIIVALALGLVLLVQRGWIQVDASMPWFLAIVLLGALSLFEDFVARVANTLGILYPPIAILLIVIFILLCLITVLQVGHTTLRRRQIQMLRHVVGHELAERERTLRERGL